MAAVKHASSRHSHRMPASCQWLQSQQSLPARCQMPGWTTSTACLDDTKKRHDMGALSSCHMPTPQCTNLPSTHSPVSDPLGSTDLLSCRSAANAGAQQASPPDLLTLMTSKTCFALGRFQGSSSRHCSMSAAISAGQSSVVRARMWPRLGICGRDDMVRCTERSAEARGQSRPGLAWSQTGLHGQAGVDRSTLDGELSACRLEAHVWGNLPELRGPCVPWRPAC